MSIIKDMSDIPYSSKTTELEPYTESFDINNNSIDFDTLDTYNESEYVFNEYNLDRIKDDADAMQENWYNDIDGDLLNKEELYQSWIDNLESETTPWNNIEWESDPETDPYSLRKSPNFGHEYNAEEDELIGGTYPWNQLVPDSNINHTASGAVVTVDDAVAGNAVSVVADFAPIQDGTPWQSAIQNEPYVYKRCPDLDHDYNSEFINAIVGGTVAWNQLMKNGNFANTDDWVTNQSRILTVANNIGTLTSNYTEARGLALEPLTPVQTIANHKYFLTAEVRNDYGKTIQLSTPYIGAEPSSTSNQWTRLSMISYRSSSYSGGFPQILGRSMSTGESYQVRNFMLIDLTQALGATIADYLYGLGSTNGIAKLKEWGFDIDSYHAYDTGSLQSVNVSAHETVGFNQWDEEWINGYYNWNDGLYRASNDHICSKNYIPVLSNTEYYTLQTNGYVIFYDSNKSYAGYVGQNVKGFTFTTPSNCAFIRFNCGSSYGNTYKNDICINISKTEGSPKNGEYEPYIKHSYPLDSDLTLRGLFKLDANNNLYAEGDTYLPSGSVTRNWGTITFDGSSDENWNKLQSGSAAAYGMYIVINNLKGSEGYGNLLADSLPVISGTDTWGNYDKFVSLSTSDNFLYTGVRTITTVEDWRTYLASNPLTVNYRLITPTTETADPYTAIQDVSPYGTEEYIDYGVSQGTRDIAVPVGHQSVYADIVPINGWDEVNVTRCGKNLFDTSKAVDNKATNNDGTISDNNYRGVSDYIRIKPNTMYYLSHISGSNVAVPACFYDKNKVFISSSIVSGGDDASGTVTSPFGAEYLIVTYRKSYKSIVQVEEGSTATDYEPYQGNIYTIDFDGTRYGGIVDVISGKMTVTMVEVDLGSLNWSMGTTFYAQLTTAKLSDLRPENATAVCSLYPWSQNAMNVGIGAMEDKAFVIGNQYRYVYIKDSSYTNASEFKYAMNGIKLVYELETPVEVILTPTQITMYAGTNNVWNTIGNTTLTYLSDAAYIDLLSNHKYLTKVSNTWSVVTGGNTVTTKVGQDAVYDLTQMFGTTIADYIDTTETATSGAGVAWFRKYFPNTRYKYEDGSLESVNTSEHVMVGFNQWDEEWEDGYYSSVNGEKEPATTATRNKNPIKVLSNTMYYINKAVFRFYYDADMKMIGSRDGSGSSLFTTPADACYLNIFQYKNSIDTTDTCINISKTEGSPKNGDYVAYSQHSYPLDSTITLRGIPKLDSNNNLIYDGDTYKFDGTVTRKYGYHTVTTSDFDGLTGYNRQNGDFYCDFVCAGAKAVQNNQSALVISSTFGVQKATADSVYQSSASYFYGKPNEGQLRLCVSGITTKNDLMTWVSNNAPVVVFELATPTTEIASTYPKFQTVDPDGTEEYVDYGVLHNTRDVSIPVGHNTTYVLISEIEESYYKNDTVTSISDPDGLFLCIQDCDNTQPLPTPESTATAYWVRFNTRGINSYNFNYIGEFNWQNIAYNINDIVWVDEGDINFYVCTVAVSYSSENTPANDTAHWIKLFSVHRDSFQIYDTMPNQAFFNNANSPSVFGVIQSDGTSIKVVDRRHSESASNPTYLNLKQVSYTIFLPNQNVDIGTSMNNLLVKYNIGKNYFLGG